MSVRLTTEDELNIWRYIFFIFFSISFLVFNLLNMYVVYPQGLFLSLDCLGKISGVTFLESYGSCFYIFNSLRKKDWFE